MAISLTNGGIPCQEITPTHDHTSSGTKFYTVSLPIGVICYISAPDTSKPWMVEFGGTCLVLKRDTRDMNGVSVMSGYAFPIATSHVDTLHPKDPFYVIRLK